MGLQGLDMHMCSYASHQLSLLKSSTSLHFHNHAQKFQGFHHLTNSHVFPLVSLKDVCLYPWNLVFERKTFERNFSS